LFFFDVFVRRVQVNFGWARPALATVGNFVLRRRPEVAQPETMDRLRSRKAQLEDRLRQLREAAAAESPATARFEASAESPADTTPLDQPGKQRPGGRPRKPQTPSMASEQPAEEPSYTERLLRAKKKVWEQRDEKS